MECFLVDVARPPRDGENEVRPRPTESYGSRSPITRMRSRFLARPDMTYGKLSYAFFETVRGPRYRIVRATPSSTTSSSF